MFLMGRPVFYVLLLCFSLGCTLGSTLGCTLVCTLGVL